MLHGHWHRRVCGKYLRTTSQGSLLLKCSFLTGVKILNERVKVKLFQWFTIHILWIEKKKWIHFFVHYFTTSHRQNIWKFSHIYSFHYTLSDYFSKTHVQNEIIENRMRSKQLLLSQKYFIYSSILVYVPLTPF